MAALPRRTSHNGSAISLASSDPASQRLHDLFQYLPSSQAVVFDSLRSEEVHAASPEFSTHLSKDPILTALAQLAAIRVGTGRCYISLIDDEHQVIIAEATSSISLHRKDRHEPGHELHLGASVLEVQAGICATTMQAFIADENDVYTSCNTENIYADRTRYVISDLSKEETYKDRPYVTGFPHMRFYAEVPIKSPRGFVIGGLAAIGSSPRCGLSEEHFDILTEIASTVMRHLEMVHADNNHQRTNRMLRGLNHYVLAGDAAASSPPPLSTGEESQSSFPFDRRDSVDSPAGVFQDTQYFNLDFTNIKTPLAGSSLDSRLDTTNPFEGVPPRTSDKPDQPREPLTDVDPLPVQPLRPHSSQRNVLSPPIQKSQQFQNNSSDLDGDVLGDSAASNRLRSKQLPRDIGSALQLAGETTREALNLEFAVFLDFDDTKAKKAGDGLDTFNQIPANVLASSFSKNMIAGQHLITTDIHHSLLRHYPKGVILNFTTVTRPQTPNEAGGPSPHDHFRSVIRAAFPGVQSVLYFPIWSESQQRWIAGGLCGTMTNKRILERDDLSYFSLMSIITLTHLARLDLVHQNKAKADFLSSMSHEIRSPIHGILGNVELAREVATDDTQRALINDIDKCGLMLLDTINHILDFAKISTAVSAGSKLPRTSKDESSCQNKGSRFQLDGLVEQVLDAAVAGHCYIWGKDDDADGQGATDQKILNQALAADPSRSAIAVVMNCTGDVNWSIRSNAPIWKRICLNLIGNALKYTDQGSIQVSLDFLPADENGDSVQTTPQRKGVPGSAVLKVRDTGKGISREFLGNYLFKPFRQEDGLAPGTGLGLSIVQHLVQELGGRIDVASELNRGTEMKVTVPIATGPYETEISKLDHPIATGCVCYFGFDDNASSNSTDTAETSSPARLRKQAVKRSLKRIARERFGLRETTYEETPSSVDLIVLCGTAMLSKVRALIQASARTIPLLVVYDNIYGTKRSLRADLFRLEQDLYQPLIPSRVTEIMGKLLQAAQGADDQGIDAGGAGNGNDVHENGITIKTSDDIRAFEALSTRNSIPASPNLSSIPSPPPISTTQSSFPQPKETAFLPFSPPSSQPAQQPQPSAAAKHTKTVAPDARPRVLIVDDNAINVRMLAAQVKKLGYEYETASDGHQAVIRFRESAKHFTCIFMDLTMPVMDGFEASRAIRAIERDRIMQAPERSNGDGPADSREENGTFIAALTGLSSSEAQQKAMQCGIDTFMVKPVPMKRVKELVEGTWLPSE